MNCHIFSTECLNSILYFLYYYFTNGPRKYLNFQEGPRPHLHQHHPQGSGSQVSHPRPRPPHQIPLTLRTGIRH